ncbi:hypothetical protein [Sphingomonas mali]|uniref:hypothetical protein n=1 Tax=Sphingomonas mali TaxID=40682 RepID=UPI000AE66342|nr:hypothetical protein [Sphingomonas mali]
MQAGSHRKIFVAAFSMASAVLLPYAAMAQSTAPAAPVTTTAPTTADPTPQSTRDEKRKETIDDTKEVVSQPAKDVGIAKTKIPPSLVEASNAPYSLAGLRTCRQIADAVRVLDAALGPDYSAGGPNDKMSVGKAAGGAVVNSLIPFRGVVREVSGAAAADRRLAAATQAGFARRGFLRGVHLTRGCREAL